MIRKQVFRDIEDWEDKEVVLSVLDSSSSLRLEKVLLVAITPTYLLCQDVHGRDQVYVTRHVLGWEPFDEVSKPYLRQQKQMDGLAAQVSVPEEEEDPGIRKVGPVRRVIQPGR